VPGDNVRPFYGCCLVLARLVCNIMASGCGSCGCSPFVTPLQQDFGWSMGDVTAGFAIFSLASGLVSLQLGKFVDRHGTRCHVRLRGYSETGFPGSQSDVFAVAVLRWSCARWPRHRRDGAGSDEHRYLQLVPAPTEHRIGAHGFRCGHRGGSSSLPSPEPVCCRTSGGTAPCQPDA